MKRAAVPESIDSHAAPSAPLDRDAEIDDSLIDMMLELTISDRLRSLSNYVTGLARFRRV
ncbi:MAG: hypothetical protein SF182_00580 [Deltaproteobacteria bacterium]|nr:hypothetical protein [Deltaproteobacteria bacterium]